MTSDKRRKSVSVVGEIRYLTEASCSREVVGGVVVYGSINKRSQEDDRPVRDKDIREHRSAESKETPPREGFTPIHCLYTAMPLVYNPSSIPFAPTMSSPRPILKRSTPSPHAPTHVHFPPSCSLTSTFTAHSPTAYDRSPIHVTPNHCALPERGCPGRTYAIDDDLHRLRSGRDLHPRALAQSFVLPPYRKTLANDDDGQRTPTLAYHLPALVPDLSSESEESDSSAYTPIDAPDPYLHLAFRSLAIADTSLSIPRPYPSSTSPTPNSRYAAYAPYSLSSGCTPRPSAAPGPTGVPPPHAFAALSASEDEDGMFYSPPPTRPRIRRRERSRSREPETRPWSDTPTDPMAPPSPPTSPSRRSPRRMGGGGMRLSGGVPRLTSSFATPAQHDSGCLGGF